MSIKNPSRKGIIWRRIWVATNTLSTCMLEYMDDPDGDGESVKYYLLRIIMQGQYEPHMKVKQGLGLSC